MVADKGWSNTSWPSLMASMHVLGWWEQLARKTEAGHGGGFEDAPGGLRRVKWLGNNMNRLKTHKLTINDS
jgi:hypothetical protein